MPTTFSRAKPVRRLSSYTMASSGLEMTMMNASGQCFLALSATSRMMGRLMPIRSSRLCPGLRGMPAVTMSTSEPAQSAQLEVPEMWQS